MFDLERMKEALDSPSFRMPAGLNNEQKKFLFSLASKNEKVYRQIECLTDENMKESVKELMYSKKLWDSEILTVGGVSYFKLENPDYKKTSDGNLFKSIYRVSMTKRGNGTLLKFRIKTANGEIFSVQSKTYGEAQFVVDTVFGKNMYSVSQMIS